MANDSSNVERYAWLASMMLVGVLAFQVPGTLAERDTDRAFARTLLTVHRLVENDYVDPVDNKKLGEAGIDGMLQQLDPYSVYIPPADKGAFKDLLAQQLHGVGIQLAQRNDGVIEIATPIEGSPAWDGGVLPGDIILRVDGKPVAGKPLQDVIATIKGAEGTRVTLGVRHAAGTEQEIALTRGTIGLPMVKGVRRRSDQAWDYWIAHDPKIAYVRLDQFTDATSDQIRKICEQLVRENLAGLVLDLRFNPGGRLDQAVNIVDLFIKSGTVVSTRGAHRPEQRVDATDKDELPDFPLVVLVNEQSASAAEVVAGSLKDNRRATIVGTRSFGKGSVQDVIDLGTQGILKLTVAHYYLPSGRLVHRTKDATDWGVEPDLVVPMDKEQEVRLMLAQQQAERMYMPVSAVAATQPATTPTTQPIDPQLDKAVDTLTALIAIKK